MTALALACLFASGLIAGLTVGMVTRRPQPGPPSLRQIEEHAYFQGWNDATSGRPYRETLR